MKLHASILLYILFISALDCISQTILYSPEPMAQNKFGSIVDIEGDQILVSNRNFVDTDKVFAFIKNGNAWDHDGELINPGQLADDNYGRSIGVDGDYAVVGADEAFNDAGRAYVFKRTGAGQWNLEQTLTSSDLVAGDGFGSGVGISGNVIVVSSGDKNNGDGAAYFFELENGNWVEKKKVTPGNLNNSRFGYWLSIHGNYAAISAHQDNVVFVYKRENGVWTEKQQLTSPSSSDSYGVSVSLWGERLLIGALNDDEGGNNAGAVYIYKRSGENWNVEQKLIASDATDTRSFGGRNALGQSYAVIGCLYEDPITFDGSAYVFKREGTTWTEVEKYETADNDFFGWGTGVSNNTAVVGVYGDNTHGSRAGAVFVYDLPEVVSTTSVPYTRAKVFPNPTSDFIYIELEDGQQPESVEVYSVNGAFIGVLKSEDSKIEVDKLSAGEYILHIHYAGEKALAKFVKQ